MLRCFRAHSCVLARLLILTMALALLALAVAAPALADPTSTPTAGAPAPGCVLGVICQNPAEWLQQTVTAVLTDVLTGIANDFGDAITGFLNQINFVTRTPENLSYNNDLVKQYASAMQLLGDGLLAVVVLVSGYNVMLRPYMGLTASGAAEFLPRLLVGAILVNTASWWCRLAIDANNAACEVFGGPSISDLVATIMRVAVDHFSGLLMLLVATVMAILLLIQQLMRLALVDVLVILAPLAGLLWILPQTQTWGRLWMRLFVGAVFAQCVQVLTLRLGFNLATGIPPLTVSGLLQPLLGIAVLALVLKIPGLMGGAAGGGNIVAGLVGTAAGAAVSGGVHLGVRAAAGTRALAASAGRA
jgi:hypothetical protein